VANPDFFSERFRSFCAASFGVADPKELPDVQRLQLEDAFYEGASTGFYHGFGCGDDEAMQAHKEFKSFGEKIVQRYADAGLPTGQRRS
jgi:hypothetical protein